ncbi:early nodulin-75-like [Salvia splendens]|uniref:early nodulin-75-like n=1 Tax=Salvia splendens TaxID=180675 RepID=UPI001C26F2B9|nr:early nodulin-75-like [Salvia splendens]
MSYDYAGYHRYQRLSYDQPPPRYRREPYGPPQPHRMGSVQTRLPTYWDPPRQRTDNCYPPPYRDPGMVPDSYVEPRNSYARYRPWQPQYHPRPATKAEDPINAKLDRLLEAFDKIDTWFDAKNRRFSKFRTLPQPEPDLDQPHVSAPLRKMAYPPSRNNEDSFGPSRLVPNESTAPPCYRTKSDQTPARQPSCWEPPLMATPAVDQIHQPYQPPLPLPRSNHPPQSSPAQPLELPP